MYCPKCGQKQLAEGVRFCSQCGFSLVEVTDLLVKAETGATPPEPPAPPKPRKRRRRLLLWAALVFLVIGGISVLVSLGSTPVGTVWWHAGAFSIGPVSSAQAMSLIEHGVCGTLALMVLAVTTPMVDLLTWLRKFHIPDPLLEIASLTYRLIFELLDTVVTASEAQHAERSGQRQHRERQQLRQRAIGEACGGETTALADRALVGSPSEERGHPRDHRPTERRLRVDRIGAALKQRFELGRGGHRHG